MTVDSDGEPTLNDDCENLECRRGQIAQGIYEGILNYVGGGGGDGGDDDGGGGGPPCDSPPCGKDK